MTSRCIKRYPLLLLFSRCHFQLFVTPWTAAGFPVLHLSRSLCKLMSTESLMPSNHLVLCHPLLLLPSVFSSILVFSNEWLFASGGLSMLFTEKALLSLATRPTQCFIQAPQRLSTAKELIKPSFLFGHFATLKITSWYTRCTKKLLKMGHS